MSFKKWKGQAALSHVRLYKWETQMPAYRSLSTDARALLVEFRGLYCGGENRVFLSTRQMLVRLNITDHHRARRARDELLERGWIVEVERGAFSRKTKQATVYALTNEPLDDQVGALATKDYMRWQPPQEKSTVVARTTDGGDCHHHGNRTSPEKRPHGGGSHHQKREKPILSVVTPTTQIGIPGGARTTRAGGAR